MNYELAIYINWGDGTDSGRLGPYVSGATAVANHKWINQGSYEIKVKAKDETGFKSDWSDPLPVTMPKKKAVNTPFLQLLPNHPNIFPVLRYLLKL